MKDYNGFTANERIKALKWLQAEYTTGGRTPPRKCDVCGQTEGIIEAHSEDYSAPYGDHIGRVGLCFLCHMEVHCRFRSPMAWKRYKVMVEEGAHFPAFYSRDFPTFVKLYLNYSVGLPGPIIPMDSPRPGAWEFLKVKEPTQLMMDYTL